MELFASYLLKSAVWLSGFALVYLLFLRKERFFSLKRIYLLGGILISFVFPLLTIHYEVEITQPSVMSYDPVTSSGAVDFSAGEQGRQFSFNYIFAGIYLAGMILLIIRSGVQLHRMFRSIRGSSIDDLGNAKLIRSSEFQFSFSFFNYVFVNPHVNENEMKEIMNHELVHVNQKHCFDLFLGESLRILQWINPFAWIYKAFIRMNHEYIADEVALQRTSDPVLYKAALLNQVFRAPVFNLTNSFNYSVTKTRFDMMKNIIASPYRKLKLLLIVPVIAVLFYAFAEPEYSYIASPGNPGAVLPGEFETNIPVSETTVADPVAVNSSSQNNGEQQQKTVRGVITDREGKPLKDAVVRSTGISDETFFDEADENGRFEINISGRDAILLFQCRGYKTVSLKAEPGKEMKVALEKDPDIPVTATQAQQPLIYIDGVLSEEQNELEVRKDLGYNFGFARILRGKEATDKYGPEASYVFEFTTRKKALEMGMELPIPRLKPEDYPTFRGESYSSFNEWVAERVNYPEEAKNKNLQGWVSVRITIGKDGSITGIEPTSSPDQSMAAEVVRVIKSAPGFDPPKNPEIDEPFTTEVSVRFKGSGEVSATDIPFVVVEQMPSYPGGDAELLKFLSENVRYPEEAKKNGIGGRVIIRFVVTTEGKAEGISVMRGVDPLLDAEAVRVVGLLNGFQPGMQSGKKVNVWYMVPITFNPPDPPPAQ